MRINVTKDFKELDLCEYTEVYFDDTTGNFEFFFNGELEETKYDDGDFEEVKRWVWVLDGLMNETRKELEKIPYDKVFYTDNGNRELCHATGYAVCSNNGKWWNEYVDSTGVYHYGR